MCPHGKITVVATLGAGASIQLGNYRSGTQRFVWTAYREVGGRVYFGVSRSIRLYIRQWEAERKAQWVMEIENVTQSLPE
jgi:hypothetical protein